MRHPLIFAAVSSALAVCSACGSGLCDSEDLIDVLAGATAGDIVEVGECTIAFTDSVTVPADVTFTGEGPEDSVLEFSGDASLILVPGTAIQVSSQTRVDNMRVVSLGRLGIRAEGSGSGSVTIEKVVVDTRGTTGPANGSGIGIAEVAEATLSRVDVIGRSSSDSYGVILLRAGEATFDYVDVSMFGFGVVAESTTFFWSNGSARSNSLAGVFVQSGDAMLYDLELADNGTMQRGLGYGAVFTGGATVASARLNVHGMVGFGLVHDGFSVGVHQDLTAVDNVKGGVRAQGRADIEVAGMFDLNGRGGVIAHDVARLVVRGSSIDRTILIPEIESDLRSTMIGDAIQVVGSNTILSLDDLDLVDNEHAGVVLELAGATLGAGSVGTIRVSSATGNGVVAQNGNAPSGWDANVTRGGATAMNDAALTMPLDYVATVGPCYRPPQDPALSDLSAFLP